MYRSNFAANHVYSALKLSCLIFISYSFTSIVWNFMTNIRWFTKAKLPNENRTFSKETGSIQENKIFTACGSS